MIATLKLTLIRE
uniref:Uncharacterized protein n=1 Tax=Rhizophora mucronata TaxID=61149 RepID=A0A2P2QXY7_RHIMU